MLEITLTISLFLHGIYMYNSRMEVLSSENNTHVGQDIVG